VEEGEALASVYARDEAGLRTGVDALRKAIRIVEEEPAAPLPLVSHRVSDERTEVIQPAVR